MATLDQFLPMIRGRLPGCPDMILKDAVRDAAIAFCKRTQLLAETTPVTVLAGVATYTLFPALGQHWEVKWVSRENAVLTPSSRTQFLEAGWDQDSGTPGYYYLEGDTQLVLGPIPAANEALTVTVTARPTDDATEVDEVLWTDYREPIAAGARAWVRRHYGEWINPQSEAEDRAIFERAIHNQNIRRARGGAEAPLRVRSHPF